MAADGHCGCIVANSEEWWILRCEEQPQIFRYVQDDSALESRGREIGGVAGGSAQSEDEPFGRRWEPDSRLGSL